MSDVGSSVDGSVGRAGGRVGGRLGSVIGARNAQPDDEDDGGLPAQDTTYIPEYMSRSFAQVRPSFPEPHLGRVTQRYMSYLAPSLSDRDLDIVSTVARFGLITGRQLFALFFSPPQPATPANLHTHDRRAQRVLQRLTDLQLLGRLQRRVGGTRGGSASFIYGLSTAGQRLLELPGRPRRLYEPLSPHIDHTLCVSELYVSLMLAHRRGQLTVLDHKTEPECWTEAMGQWLKPDAYLRVQTLDGRRHRWYLELDRGGPRGAQSERRIQDKLDQYRLFYDRQLLEEPVFPRVLFVAIHEQRARQLQAIIDRQPVESRDLYRAVSMGDAARLIASGGDSAPTITSQVCLGGIARAVAAAPDARPSSVTGGG